MGMPSETKTVFPKNLAMPDNFIAAMAIGAGFQGEDAVTAVAVALGESGGRPGAVNTNANGSKDWGLWQINYPAHAGLIDGSENNWSVPTTNAVWARAVWQQSGGSWKAWSAYSNGRYLMYMNRARTAVSSSDLEGAKKWINEKAGQAISEGQSEFPGAVAAQSVTEPLLDILKLVGKIFDPKTWVSVGLVLAGAVMLLLVGWQLLKGSGVSRTVKSVKGVVT